MLGYTLHNRIEIATNFTTDTADAKMVSRMRLILAISTLLAVFIDPSGLSGISNFTWLVFSGYVLHSAFIYIFSLLNKPLSQSKLIHWLDVCWYALIVFFTGGINSFFSSSFFSPLSLPLSDGVSKRELVLLSLQQRYSPRAD